MGKIVTVQRGDCLISICDKEKLNWETVWDHPKNQQLKEKRKHANILKAGDKVYLPTREFKHEDSSTEATHKFKVRKRKVKFTLTILDLGEPRADEKYTLKIGGFVVAQGRTDGSGTLTEYIPAHARRGYLYIGEKKEAILLKFGYVDPIDELTGIQWRLKNLGLYRGKVDDIMGPLTKAAIAEFQRRMNISGEGKLNDETRKALLREHGS